MGAVGRFFPGGTPPGLRLPAEAWAAGPRSQVDLVLLVAAFRQQPAPFQPTRCHPTVNAAANPDARAALRCAAAESCAGVATSSTRRLARVIAV